ncbi:MAG: gp436 family protein [Ramlibacter sp.]|nr:DUF1320 family protein [Ramlibacter sp.]
MPYASAQDMITAFGQAEMRDLTDVGPQRLDDVDMTVLNAKLQEASALIDGYLVGRYPLPLAEPPQALRVHCQGLARYLLMTNAPDERAKADMASAYSYLKLVSSGMIALLPPAQAPVPTGMGPVVFNAGAKVFGRGDD